MRILHVVRGLKRKGPIDVLYNLVKHHVRKGHQVCLVLINDQQASSRFDEFLSLGIEIINLKLKTYNLLKLPTLLRKHIFDWKPDVVQANCLFSEFGLSKVEFENKICLIHNFPKEDYRYKFGRFVGFLLSELSCSNWKKYKCLLTVSEANSTALQNCYNLPVKAINNGITYSNGIVITPVVKKIAREKLLISGNKFVFVYVDSLIQRKDPETAIKGFLEFAKDNDNSILLLAGGGNLLQKLQGHYSNFRNIRFLGHVKNIPEVMVAGDYYLTSSFSESYHLSVPEALFYDLPIICSDIEIHRFFVSLQQNIGLLFKTGDYIDLADKLKQAVNTSFVSPKLDQSIIQKYHLTAEMMADEYLELYENLINDNL